MFQSASAEKRQAKLGLLVELEGYLDLSELLQAAMADTVSPSICMNEGCDYTAEYEGDCRDGWCEACSENTVVSALVLAEII
jgi:hypothetical protein